jgi:pimeloyl-ACP methyl ester carboxylesterase
LYQADASRRDRGPVYTHGVSSLLARALSLAGLVALALPPRASAQEILTVPTRPGVTVRVLLVASSRSPSATVLMFPGGFGDHHFGDKDGRVWLGKNFLLRAARPLAARDLLVAVIDTPSDQPKGMDDAFRMGKAHVEDVEKVLAVLAERSPVPVYLAGTSRGTLSAAYLAASIKDPRVKGLVLTTSLGDAGRGRNRAVTVYDAPLKRITMPVLVVHHVQDTCWASPFGAATGLPAALSGSAKVDFVAVSGGDPPRSEPCESLAAHGFVGRELLVVGVIADWIAGNPVPKEIGR